MVSVAKHRRKRKFLSTGKHAAPSQVGIAAQKAGKAVPAVAIAGALAAASQAGRSAAPAPLSSAHHRVIGASAESVHAVAGRYAYGARRSEISHPNPLNGPAAAGSHGYAIAGDVARPVRQQVSTGGRAPSSPAAGTTSEVGGTLTCSGLEGLWRSAGGAPSQQVTAASIAMAESAGEQFATGPFGERGYWQINPDHGTLSTYNAWGNARAAVILSGNGTDWSPWTTFVDGAYVGRC